MTHLQMSKKGGQAKSEAKSRAARKNWKKAQVALAQKRKRGATEKDSGKK